MRGYIGTMRALRPEHRPIAVFLAKMLAAYAAWFVLYDLWLLPAGLLDGWVGRSAAVLSGGLLDALGLDPTVDGRVIRLPSGSGVWVADACTGLATVGLFAGFVLAYPGSWRRRVWFLPLGVLVIHLANVVRIAGLAWLRDVEPALFDPVHQWGATPFFYAVVFGLWVVWVHYGGPRPRPERASAAAARASESVSPAPA